MNKRIKTIVVWLSAIAVAIIAAAVLLLRTTIVEEMKRESAKLFEYEYIPNQRINIDSCAASLARDSIYRDFRRKYRFHYQTIAMASFDDSSRIILLSDLPPHFETDSVPLIFAEFTHKTELLRHRIGYDGYVTDMTITLGNATRENCDRLLRRLNKELFFSEYKPTVMPLPAKNKRLYFSGNKIDYQITLDEFNTWFIEENEGFVQLDGTGTVLTVADMFNTRSYGVFFSQEPGFVAWSLAKNEDIAAQIGNIRQFTLDADLILGALADSNTLVIIGRERQSPLHELPPLQVESILLLASTSEKELSQSLDINDLMAGKMVNGRDWCPTYLSRELENTEFGDLMTITDILLKDWSEHGTIQESHYRYPKPGHYPFDKPLFRKLGVRELVYNWNTAGAMYAIDCDSDGTQTSRLRKYTIYTLGRTGSLPVSYFNSQQRSQSVGYSYESQAYNYFATLGNTDLARVVQYTALYQLFIDNNISYSGNTYPSFPKNKPFLLSKPTKEFLNTFRQMSDTKISALADSLSARSFVGYQKEHIDKQLRDNELKHNFSYTDQNIEDIYRNVHQNTKSGISGSITQVRNMLNSLSDEQFTRLAKYLSYPRGVKVNNRESHNTYMQANRVNQMMREIGKNNLDLIGMDLKEVKDWYAANLSGNAGRYMKTSSLIVTYNDMLTTGGHNLSSKISRVNSMTNYRHRPGSHTGKTSTPPPVRKANTTPKSKTAKQPSTRTTVRPRGDVISTAPRGRRGL